MNRFIEGGRLTDRHKNKISTEQTLNRLNQIAKDKVMKLDENRTKYIYEYDKLFHKKVVVAEGECLICKHCTDVFYDDSNGPYMVFCECTKRIGKDEYSLATLKKYGESCPKYEYDGIERGKVNG